MLTKRWLTQTQFKRQKAKTSDYILSRKYEALPNHRDIYQKTESEGEKDDVPLTKPQFWIHYDVLIIVS